MIDSSINYVNSLDTQSKDTATIFKFMENIFQGCLFKRYDLHLVLNKNLVSISVGIIVVKVKKVPK